MESIAAKIVISRVAGPVSPIAVVVKKVSVRLSTNAPSSASPVEWNAPMTAIVNARKKTSRIAERSVPATGASNAPARQDIAPDTA